ncbi:type IV secretory system conjugative DNA transfer family protein [Actinoplanes xinjiangensis]|uniref:Type IV secretory pathway TraG/TraD family ATPase VirD4 n=1 Tax=Actinoplanes xinjiangensis TaxID=512350 RepID=A0A316F8L2_9ACTN|nr:TraM recognition domain-containing protein [Actinoplanes xinjiangensis]PWK43543.1 type IV secretory pathway TraG/TraD family ATPase VirD4 [Actinoplanes xinjiangensis]GIF41860.1 conjugal transfer protein TraG [Actinoplanes xinjiangensis]
MDFPPIDSFTVTARQAVYLGLDPLDGHRPCWSNSSDSVGVVGPPRYGKSSGILIPTLMGWDGPAVVTSTRPDLLQFTGNRRRELASGRGGHVYVYDPFASVPGVTSVQWSPIAGCENPSVAYRRASAMVAVVGQGISDSAHWTTGAASILRALFHAAALDGSSIVDVRRRLARQETDPAAAVLRASTSEAVDWADDLDALQLLGDRERGSFYSMARNCIDATAEPRVRASALGPYLDIDAFLTSGSTLFIVGPSHHQKVAAPLIVGLVDAIAQRAAELAATRPGGRLDPALLLALDEIANIAPLESLPSLASEGGGAGIVTLWAAQSLAQLRARYGADLQQAILTATTAKVIYGGMSNGADLRDISSWAGEYRQAQTTYYAGGPDPAHSPDRPGRLADRDASGRQHAIGSLYRPVLPVDALQQLPPGRAWLFYRSDAPLLVETRPAGLMPPYKALSGYTPLLPLTPPAAP